MPRGIWGCKIGETEHSYLPDGADLPMRNAVRQAYRKVTGEEPEFIFSGWADELTPTQQQIIDEDRNARKSR